MKISAPTTSGHAFILRRYDTGAVSLTTMFRAAYPEATESEEKREYQWVKERYDLSGNNGSGKEPHITRLAGTWIGPDVALELGADYHLSGIMDAVVNSEPDPSGNYRRSGKPNGSPNGAAQSSSPAKTQIPRASLSKAKSPAPFAPPQLFTDNGAKSLPTPSHASPTKSSPAKRRRESPAAPEPVVVEPTPAKSNTVRRSTRTKSPAPRSSAPLPPLTSIPRPTKKKAIRRDSPELEEPAQEEGQESIEDVASSGLYQQDVQEQREMIEDLKLQREEAMKATSTSDEDAAVLKRSREEDQELAFEFKEPEVGERALITNRRVQNAYERLQPEHKSAMWGAAAFSFGLAAITFLPSFF